jgi:hypothetical protein
MRRNDSEMESPVGEPPVPSIPGHNPPALFSVTVLDLIERLESRLTGPLRAYYFAHQERIQKALFNALKEKKNELREKRVIRKTTGSIAQVSNEAVYTYPNVQAAKDAVVGMVADLAVLPPPLPKPYNDDAGFSLATNGALRAFLSRVAGGYADDQDYLYAARLLITHSKTQLPRQAVMGAVRTLENYLKPARLTKPGAKKPDEQDFHIYSRTPLARGSIPLTKTGNLNWRYDPKTGYLSLSTKTLDLFTAQNAINEAGGNAVPRAEEKGGYKNWYLDISIKEVPLLIDYLRDQYPNAADRLQTSWEGWTEQAAKAPAPRQIKKGSKQSARLPRPATGKVTGALHQGEYYAPDQRHPAFSWEVTPAGVMVGLTTRDRFQKRGGLPGESVSALFSFSGYFNRYGKRLTVDKYKVLVPTTPTQLAVFLQEWREGADSEGDLKEIPAVFAYLPALAEAWEKAGLDAQVQLSPGQMVTPQGIEKEVYTARAPRRLALGGGETVDLSTMTPKLHDTWEELVSGDSKQIVRDLSFVYQWSRLLPKEDKAAEMVRIKGGDAREQSQSKIQSSGFKGETPLPSWSRSIDTIAAVAKELTEPSFSACRGVFVVPTSMVGTDFIPQLGDAWGLRALAAATDATKSKIVIIGTDNVSEICGWFLYAKYRTDIRGNKIVDKETGQYQKEVILNYYSANLAQTGYGEDTYELMPGWGKRIDLKENLKYAPFPVPVVLGEIRAGYVPRLARALDLSNEFVLSYTMRIALLSAYMLNCPKAFPVAAAAKFSDIPQPERAQIENMYDWDKMQYLNKDYPGGPKMMGLMEYQKIGAAYVWLRGGRALIGDAMGLGKTVQAITAVRMRAPQTLPVVVVCPSSVLYNWAAEIDRWYPGAKVFVGTGPILGKLGDGELTDAERNADFIIMGWSSTSKYGPRYYDRIKTLIVDESHYGKKFDSVRSIGARELSYQAEYSIVMSGTALDNAKLEELWPQLSMVDPVAFGEALDGEGYYKYTNNFVPSEKNTSFKGNIPTLDTVDNLRKRLGVMLRCYMVRRLKNQVPLGLGEKTRVYREVLLTPAQRKIYDTEMAKVLEVVIQRIREKRIDAALKFIHDGKGKITVYQATEMANELEYNPKKIAGTAFVVYLIARQAVAKVKTPFAIETIVTRLKEHPNDPVVVFVEFDENMGLIRQALDARSIPYVYIDGKVPPLERRRRVEAFQKDRDNSKVKVFIGTRAAREGITLTRANYTLFVDRWYVPAWEEQAEDRTYRYTQTRDVTIEFLVVKDTIDEQLNALIERKRQIIGDVVGEDKFEELQEKGDKVVEEEYATDLMETLRANIEGLSGLTEEDTIIDEQMVRDAAAEDDAFTDKGVQAIRDPGTSRPKQREIYKYLQSVGGSATYAALEAAGLPAERAKAGIEAGYFKVVTIPRVLKNNGLVRTDDNDGSFVVPPLTLADIPKFKVQPGQFKLRQIVDRKVTENPRRVSALVPKRHR